MIDCHRGLEPVDGQSSVSLIYAGIVDHDVEQRGSCGNFPRQLGDLRHVGQIAPHGGRLGALDFAPERRGDAARFILVAAMDQHMPAASKQLARRFKPDSVGGAGDQGDLHEPV